MGRKLTIQTVVAIGFAIACDPSEAEPTGAIAEFDFEFETGGDQTLRTLLQAGSQRAHGQGPVLSHRWQLALRGGTAVRGGVAEVARLRDAEIPLLASLAGSLTTSATTKRTRESD